MPTNSTNKGVDSQSTADIQGEYTDFPGSWEGFLDAFIIIVLIIVAGIVALWLRGEMTSRERRRASEVDAAGRRRLTECEEVVRYFANQHGYLARTVVSREDLAEQIDAGVTADELTDFIIARMEAVDGIELGSQAGSWPIKVPQETRARHMYVVGKSGYGKTNLLRYLILQDISKGAGIGVLAPEAEMLTEEILPFIPEERLKDVIYFNPADLAQPVVLNPLHLDQGDDIDLHVDETFTILQRVVGEGGPRMDEILRHSLYALCERQGSTLLDLEPLLDRQDDALREAVIASTQDEQTKRFFLSTYPQFPKDAHFPIVNRISRLVRNKYVRNCLCPPTRTSLTQIEIAHRLLNVRTAMDHGKILLFNLSDGILGEAASQLIGQLIVAKFQTATMSRANIAKGERRPFYLYLDEFQNFCSVASQSYEKLLSRARKYGLGLILAHQQTRQVPLELYREILGNVSTLISFQVAQADAGRLAPEFISQIDLSIEALPPEELLRLNIGEAYCRIGKTTMLLKVPKIDLEGDPQMANAVITASRQQSGIPRLPMGAGQPPQLSGTDDPLADIDPEGVFE
ncbi:MAG: TraM recognition domain-containing protein [Candidatus Zixiibacteriota bacterium]